MRLRCLACAVLLGGAGLLATAAPASAQCDPQPIEGGDPCPNSCMDTARAWDKIDARLGGVLPEYPFLCTQ